MIYNFPSGTNLQLDTIILDLNGTLAVHGNIAEGVKEQIDQLKVLGFEIFLLSGDTRGNAQKIADTLGITLVVTSNAKEKGKFVESHHPDTCASIGNGKIDLETFKLAKLSIATLQAEGVFAGAIPFLDIIVPSIQDALQLLIDPNTLVSTLRE